jgi:hypothetical protein
MHERISPCLSDLILQRLAAGGADIRERKEESLGSCTGLYKKRPHESERREG